jgi:hypothetical protein
MRHNKVNREVITCVNIEEISVHCMWILYENKERRCTIFVKKEGTMYMNKKGNNIWINAREHRKSKYAILLWIVLLDLDARLFFPGCTSWWWTTPQYTLPTLIDDDLLICCFTNWWLMYKSKCLMCLVLLDLNILSRLANEQ